MQRSYSDNITRTDWQRNNYWRAVGSVTGTSQRLGDEGDPISVIQKTVFDTFPSRSWTIDISDMTMRQRMQKSR